MSVAPPGANPVDVLTKSAPTREQMRHSSIFRSSLGRYSFSKITLYLSGSVTVGRAGRNGAAAANQVSDFLVGLFSVSDPGEARGWIAASQSVTPAAFAGVFRAALAAYRNEAEKLSAGRRKTAQKLGAEADVKVDVATHPVLPGDVLVLASDGLTKMIEDDEIVGLLAERPPPVAVKALIDATLDLGGSGIRTLYMDSGSAGFATIVAWDGNLAFSGTGTYTTTSTTTVAGDLTQTAGILKTAQGSAAGITVTGTTAACASAMARAIDRRSPRSATSIWRTSSTTSRRYSRNRRSSATW